MYIFKQKTIFLISVSITKFVKPFLFLKIFCPHMVDYQTQKIHSLMNNTKNIRNISVIAHVDHGKSTLTDCLLIKARIASKEANGGRYMDTRKDEQERGITIKSTAVSMSFSVEKEVLEAYVEKTDYNGEEFLINLIDSPGHVDFSSEVTAALRVTDGALVVVDCVDGICVQTETVMRQAIQEKIGLTLVLNKLDRAILELGYTVEELSAVVRKRIEAFNAKVGVIAGDSEYIKPLSVKDNQVSFCSGLQGWGFTLNKFARFYLNYKGKHTFEKEKKFTSLLWSVKHYCDFDDEFAADYKFEKIVDGQIPKGKKSPFEMFVLAPIYKVKDWCFEGNVNAITEYLKKFGVDCSKLDLEGKQPGKNLFKAVFKAWLPAAECLLEQIILKLPNPHRSQAVRADSLYTGPKDESYNAIKLCSCNDEDPVTIYISKMIPDGSNGFVAFGRIFSGNIKPGTKVYVQSPEYIPDPETKKDNEVVVKTVTKVCVMMGRGYSSIPNCPAGNIVGLVGVEGFLKKTGTVSTRQHSYNIKTMKFSVSPVVKVAVAPKKSQDLSHFKEGLDKLSKSDPLVQIEFTEQGQATVACAGELHLEIILSDLRVHAKCDFRVEKPQVTYFEGFTGSVDSPAMTKSANKHNRIYMTCEPLQEEIVENVELVNVKDVKLRNQKFREVLNIEDEWVKKIMFFAPEVDPTNVMVDDSKGIQYLNEVKDHIFEGFKLATKEGPIIGETIRGGRFNLTDLVLHADAIHRGANQIIRPVEQIVRGLVLSASPVLYEPIFNCTITVPEEHATACENVIKQRRGYIEEFEVENGCKISKAFLPVQASFGLNKDLREVSRGHCTFNLSFDHHAECPGSLEKESSVMSQIVAEVREYKKITTKLDADAYFDTL